METPKWVISSSVTHSLVQKQADSHTATSNVNGRDYRSTPSTRKWLIGPLASSGSARDRYTPWSGWRRKTPWPRYRNNWLYDSYSPRCPDQRARPDSDRW